MIEKKRVWRAEERLGALETLGSVLWFGMDSCWMSGLDTAATALIAPTLLFNLATLGYSTGAGERLVGSAMNCWLAMNVVWMLGDIRGGDAFHWEARVFSLLGFVFLLAALVNARATHAAVVQRLRRFRRLRVSIFR